MNGLLVIAVLFAVFWFVLIRPQRNRAKEQQELIGSLESGDEIVTTGGLYGVITEVDGEVLHVEIADGLVVRTARSAIAGIVEVDDEDEEEADEDDQTTEEGRPTEPTDAGSEDTESTPPGEMSPPERSQPNTKGREASPPPRRSAE